MPHHRHHLTAVCCFVDGLLGGDLLALLGEHVTHLKNAAMRVGDKEAPFQGHKRAAAVALPWEQQLKNGVHLLIVPHHQEPLGRDGANVAGADALDRYNLTRLRQRQRPHFVEGGDGEEVALVGAQPQQAVMRKHGAYARVVRHLDAGHKTKAGEVHAHNHLASRKDDLVQTVCTHDRHLGWLSGLLILFLSLLELGLPIVQAEQEKSGLDGFKLLPVWRKITERIVQVDQAEDLGELQLADAAREGAVHPHRFVRHDHR
mmetsp:Transcript_5588/g.14140  ORF Transcript_5588/g.14140 Transcript_5588/m.14140 type:complete len:260 (+) Transcript_5588:584-1363(+)